MPSNLGNAYAVALAVVGKDEEAVYHAVEVVEFGSDERKADLYAQLAEKITATTPFEEVVSITEAAMDNTDRRFPHG